MSSRSAGADPEPTPTVPYTRRSLWFEIALVFTITLGMSGLRSLVSLIDRLLAPVPLASQTVSIVAPAAKANLLDLTFQLLLVVQGLAWGGLGLYLLWRAGINLRERLGIGFRPRDLLSGTGLAATIGIPGVAFFILSAQLGINANVVPSVLNDVWWRVPVLVLAAIENGFAEEFLVVGYLVTRLCDLRLPVPVILLLSAALRGSYHLYQGFGAAVGNLVMGLVFAAVFLRWQRIWPLVIAHSAIDIVAFIGYPLIHQWGWL